jgi:hypothetical protein
MSSRTIRSRAATKLSTGAATAAPQAKADLSANNRGVGRGLLRPLRALLLPAEEGGGLPFLELT